MDEQLVAVLSREKYLPEEALQRAFEQPDSVAEPVLAVLERAAAGPGALTEDEQNLFFWGLHALAAARDTRVFPLLLRLLRRDDDSLEELLGDAIGDPLPRVLASSFDGDMQAFTEFLLDGAVSDYVRFSAFLALGFLTREGRIDRDAAHAVLARFWDARVSVEGSMDWAAWEETIAYLGFADLAPRVEAAYRDGHIPETFNGRDWFGKAVAKVNADPPDLSESNERQYGYLDDPVAALDWVVERPVSKFDGAADKLGLGFQNPVTNPFRNVGRNDPCPCGSGKKYKKCCLAAEPAAAPLPGLG